MFLPSAIKMSSSASTTGSASSIVPYSGEQLFLLRRQKWLYEEALYWHYKEEKRRLKRCRLWFVQTFGKYLREYVYQFVDERTADAMVELEIKNHYPQLQKARRYIPRWQRRGYLPDCL